MYPQKLSQNWHKNKDEATRREPTMATCLYENFRKTGPFSNPKNPVKLDDKN